MMRVATLAIALVSVVLAASLVVRPVDRAAADYNISGQWFLELNGGVLCKAIVAETYDSPPTYSLSMLVGCVSGPPFGKMVGTIDANTGSFTVSRPEAPFGGTFSMTGTVPPDNHSMSGTWIAHTHVTPGLQGTFTGTGGDGGPKPGTATPLPIATPTATPPPVGGVALDATTGHGAAVHAWWLITLAGASAIALCGAGLYARRRLAASETDR